LVRPWCRALDRSPSALSRKSRRRRMTRGRARAARSASVRDEGRPPGGSKRVSLHGSSPPRLGAAEALERLPAPFGVPSEERQRAEGEPRHGQRGSGHWLAHETAQVPRQALHTEADEDGAQVQWGHVFDDDAVHGGELEPRSESHDDDSSVEVSRTHRSEPAMTPARLGAPSRHPRALVDRPSRVQASEGVS
jgi:hypothetical protein